MKENLSAAASAAGLMFLMWLFFIFPTIQDVEPGLRLSSAAMGTCVIAVAIRSGKLASRAETWALGLSGAAGIAVFIVGMIGLLVR